MAEVRAGLERERRLEQREVDLSVVVLLERGQQTALEIYREYAPPLRELGLAFEFVFVCGQDDGDLFASVLEEDEPRGSIRLLEAGQPVGQSAVLRLSLDYSRGRVVLSLPPSFRVAPSALPRLIRSIEEGSDVAVARRWPRRDKLINRLQSSVVAWLLGILTGARFHDITCRVSAIRRDVLTSIPLYGSYFRFIPIIAEREGFRVVEVPVEQHPRGGQTRLYRLPVYVGWLIDIFGIFFLLRFTYQPLRFFGSLGGAFGLLGGGILFVLALQRLGGQGIANRPMLLLGVMLLTVGVQLVALGLIGEIVVHFQAAHGRTYRLARTRESS